MIKDVAERVKTDRAIIGQIENIKGHEWVRVIEAEIK